MEEGTKKLIKTLVPGPVLRPLLKTRNLLKNLQVLAFDYGQYISIKKDSSIDANKEPIPWYTYPTIDFLKQLDLSKKNVFEWGSGNSSLWWSKKAKSVISIEDDQGWYNKISKDKPDNSQMIYLKDKDEYINSIKRYKKKFDIIVIDGTSYRYECAVKAVNHLSDNGMIIVDNSDWLPNITKHLSDKGLIQIDFSGFGPIVGGTWVTSIFITRGYNFHPISGTQPKYRGA